MKKLLTIFLLFYYVFGSICLPLGDFSFMGRLSDMYANCQQEDPDITPTDFVFEHLLNFEILIDKFEHHSTTENETPHQPFSVSNHLNPVVLFVDPLPEIKFKNDEQIIVKDSREFDFTLQ
ncbi:MAG TPA: hypothetical protein PKW62_09925, partial [Chitinophagaceae bacterium]|nr:hypothetical protein [Chitinophagaceae bacterium]